MDDLQLTGEKKRIVAIVGRPNVGKSAIFNRLAGRRVAIVHKQSGVTRDRLMMEIDWRGDRFEIVDTGGVCLLDGELSRDEIDAGILTQVRAALRDATAAILVVDIEGGTAPMDIEVADLLRKSECFTVVAANKADNPARDSDAHEFERLGFPVFPVSALHNRGFGELMPQVVKALPPPENEEKARPLKVAIIGRPNVGKSSYVNRVLRSDRVIVSGVPGTTRDSVEVPFTVGKGAQARHYKLIDTAGMRRLKKIDSSVERFGLFRAEKSIRRADVVVLMLDTVQGPTAQDRKIAALVQQHNKGCVLVVNKWDLSECTQRRYGPEIFKCMPFVAYCPVIFISAKTGYNIRQSIDAIDYVASQVRTTLPTGILNRVILDAAEKVHAPSVKGRRLKIFYSTQVGCEPVRIRIFVNDPRVVKPEYRQYLTRRLREKFGLEGAPVILQFRSRRPVGRT